MTFKVRVHAYQGLKDIPKVLPTQFSSDSVSILREPYLWGQTLDSAGAVPVPSAADLTANVKVLRVEVADDQSIRYEIKNAANTRAAGANSPKLSGVDIFEFAPGWTFEFVDAASV